MNLRVFEARGDLRKQRIMQRDNDQILMNKQVKIHDNHSSVMLHDMSTADKGDSGLVTLKNMEGKAENASISNLRQLWEANAQRDLENQLASNSSRFSRTYTFPRWCSNDALTASLTASKSDVEIPKGSKIPNFRLQMFEETENKAKLDKENIHQNVKPKASLNRGASVESLNLQVDYKPWFDETKIGGSINNESIADIKATRSKFESYIKDDRNTSQSQLSTRLQVYERNAKAGTVHFVSDEKPYTNNSTTWFEVEQPVKTKLTSNTEYAKPTSAQNMNRLSYRDFSENEKLFLTVLRENINFVRDIGITVPNDVQLFLETLPRRRANLRMEFEEPRKSIDYREMQFDNERKVEFAQHISQSNQSVLQGFPLKSPNKNIEGSKYSKPDNSMNFVQNHNKPTIITNKPTIVKKFPENKRSIIKVLDSEKAGRPLISAEIHMLKERENELRLSREMRGLPEFHSNLQ